MYKKARRLLSLMLVASMLSTSAVPVMATGGGVDAENGSYAEADGDVSLPAESGDSETDSTSGSEDKEAGSESAPDTNGLEADDEDEAGTSDSEEDKNSDETSSEEKDAKETGRTDGEYDPQPETLEEVQEWIDAYIASDYDEAAQPYWEEEVDQYLLPDGWECVLVDDDAYFGVSYYTIRSIYPPEDEEGDSDENEAGEIVITADDVTILLGDESFDLLDGVSATDEDGGDISSQVVVYSDGGFDVDTLGDYRVMYAVLNEEADADGSRIITAVQRVVTVADELPEPPAVEYPLLTAEDLYLIIDAFDEELELGYYTYTDGAFLEGVTAYDSEGNDVTDLVEVTSYGELGEALEEGDLLPMGEYTIQLAAIREDDVLVEGSRTVTIGTGIMPLPGGITYTIIWYDWDDEVIEKQEGLEPGDRAAAPLVSGLDNYTHEGWILLVDDDEDIKYTTAEVNDLVASVNRDMNFKVWYEPMQTKLVIINYLLLLNPDRIPGEEEETIPFDSPFVGEYPIADGRLLEIESPKKEGYTIQGDMDIVRIPLDEYREDVVVDVYYVATEGTVVIYYRQESLDGLRYEIVEDDTEFWPGRVGEEVNPPVKTYPGFEQVTFETTTIQPGENKPLYVDFDRLSYAMYFDTDEGTYAAPFSERYGADITSRLPVPDVDFWKSGYDFDGWIITPNGEDDDWNDGSTLPTKMPATDVYAKATWREKDQVSYSVVYWLERIDATETTLDEEADRDGGIDRGYDYVDEITMWGKIGEKVEVPPHDPNNTLGVRWPYANLFNDINYQGNPIDHAYRNETMTARDEKKTINADGSTVVNVYYDRTTHFVKFDPVATSNATYTYSWVVDGVDYALPGNEYTIKAKYGDYIANQWPAELPERTTVSNGAKHLLNNWTNPRDPSSVSSKRANMLGDVTWGTVEDPQVITGYYGTGYEQTLYYKKQPIGSPKDVEREDYQIDDDLTQWAYSSSSTNWGAKELLGFKAHPKEDPIFGKAVPNPEYEDDPTWTEGSTTDRIVLFYYYRDRYALTFKNGTEVWAEIDDSFDWDPEDYVGVHYQMPLKGYDDKVPPISDADAPDEYQGWKFVGWATRDGEDFDFENETMPQGNLELFSKWEQPSNEVDFYIIEDDGTRTKYIPTQDIPLRERVAEPTPPTKPEHEFVGWYTKPNPEPTDVKYVFDFPVDDKLELFAHFRLKTDVKYVAEYYRDNYDPLNRLESFIGYGKIGETVYLYGFGEELLKKHYLDGFFVDEYQKPLTIVEDEEQNIVRFLYTERESVDYTIRYLEVGTERELHPEETETESKNVVTIPYKKINGYWPQVSEIVLPLAVSGNVATFYYNPFNAETYTVEHYLQKLEGNNAGSYPTAEEIRGTEFVETLSAPVASTATAVRRDSMYPGYVYDPTVSLNKLSGVVTSILTPGDTPLVLRVYYKLENYTVNYDSKGGSYVAPQNNVFYGQLIDEPADPVKTGYVFDGWYTDEDFTHKWDFAADTMPADHMTLIAKWTAKGDLTLTFDYNNADRGDEEKSRTVIFDEPVGKLPAPEKDGYKFTGWYDASGNQYFDDTIYQVDGNTTLYAEWEALPQTITYYPNNGTSDPSHPETVDYDTLYPIKSADDLGMSHPDYWMVFRGWTENADGSGKLYEAGSDVVIKGDMNFYAKWEADDDIALSVTYNANGGKGGYVDSGLAPGIDYVVLANDTAPVNIIKDYFIFKGWSKYEDGSEPVYFAGDFFELRESETLWAKWEHDGETYFRITYEPNKGEGETEYGDWKVPGESDTVLSDSDWNYERDGFEFTGWNTAENGSGTPYKPGNEIVMDENVTLYAQWRHLGEKYYRVTYHSNDGKDLEYKTPDPGIIPDEDDIIASQADTGFVRDGFYIEKWTTEENGGGDTFYEDDSITLHDNVDLYAQWKHDGKLYYVTYHSNDGKNQTKISDGIVPGANETAITETASGFSYFAFYIESWNTQPDGKGTRYEIGGAVPVNGNMDLYAQWSHNGEDFYNVTYYSNNDENESKLGANVIPGQLGDVEDNTFKRPYGFKFVGWNTQADGKGTPYAPGNKILVDSPDVKLYAQWEPNGYEFYYITYEGNGGIGEDGETFYKDPAEIIPGQEGTVLELSDTKITRFGYKFLYWTDSDGSKEYHPGEKVVLNDDLTLYAIWEVNDDERYNFVYDGNGGKDSEGNTTYTERVTPQDTINILTIADTRMTRPYYEFVEWNTRADGQGTAYQPGEPYYMDGDMTLYAQWKHDGDTFFHVTYMANDRGQGGPTDGEPKYPGETDTLKEPEAVDIYALYAGWEFKGWSTEKDGSAEIRYMPGDTIELNDNVTLWAQWEHDGKTFYSVTYLPGGGQGGDWDEKLIPGEPYTVRTQAQAGVTHTSDWKFLNWSTNGSSPIAYAEEEVIEHLTSSLFLYAQWDYTGEKITITYDANRGEGSYSEQFNPGFEYTVKWHDDPLVGIRRHGHEFIEWNTEPDGSGDRYKEGNKTKFTDDVTLYAQWKHDGKTYVKVIYDANKGVGTRSYEVIPGEDHVVLSDTVVGISRLGHAFQNWNREADGSGKSLVAGNTVTPLNDDITLYAQWKWDNKTKVTLAYHANGGTGGDSIELIPGETVDVLSMSAAGVDRLGHYFQGWNMEAGGGGKAYAPGESIKVDVDTTLYAQWEWDKTTYVSLKYDANGGTGSHTVDKIIPGDTRPAIDPANATVKFTRYGFEFQGWNTQADGKGQTYKIDDLVKVDKDTILYAQWKHDGKTFYKVYYMSNLGDGKSHIVDVIPGSEHTILKLSDTGISSDSHEFVSWNTLATGTGITRNPGDKIVVNSATILHGQWNKIMTYQVTYDPNGGQGTVQTASPVVAGQNDTTWTVARAGFTRKGHSFAGWNTKEDGTGTMYAENRPIPMSDDVTLYAQWVWDGRTLVDITYYANGGTGGGTGPSLKPGEKDTILAPTDASLNVERLHHDFLGWNTKADGTGTMYQPDEVVQLHDSMELYAQWKWDGTYVYVTYNPNGGTDAGTIVMSDDEEKKIPVIPGEPHTILSAEYFNFARRGHNFLGWGTEKDVETPPVVYIPGNVITVNDDVDLYASWYYDEVSLVTITYDANGGTGTNTVSVVPGRSVSLRNASDHKLERKGYEFVGWAMNPEGPETIIPDNEPSKVYYYRTNNNVTLYAIWKVDPTAEVKVRYFPNGADEGDDYISGVLRPGDSYTILDPAKDPLKYSKHGYIFTGWTTNPNGTGDSYGKDQLITITGEDDYIDLYAQWKHDGKTYYQIFYMPNGGSGYALDNVVPGDSYTVRTGASATVTREGYVVAYWTDTDDNGVTTDYAGGDVIVPTGHMRMYAQWVGSNVTYRVAYDATEGTGGITDTGISPVGRYTIKNADQAKVTRNGYTLADWNTIDNGYGDSYGAGEKIILKGDMDLYAQWNYKEGYEFKVTYDSNGADGLPSEYDGGGYTLKEKHVVLGNDVVGFTYTDADFIYWTLDPEGSEPHYHATDEIEITKDITLYAQWEMIPQDRNITYHSNYGKDSVVPPAIYNPLNEVHIVKGIDFAGGDNAIPGLTFRNWNTEPNGSGKTYVPNEPLPPSGDITLYAQWDYDGFTTYRVTFMPNTAQGGLGAPKIEFHQPGGEAIDPATNGISHPDLAFAGWDTAMDGTGTRYTINEAMYLSGATILFAQWQ